MMPIDWLGYACATIHLGVILIHSLCMGMCLTNVQDCIRNACQVCFISMCKDEQDVPLRMVRCVYLDPTLYVLHLVPVL